MNLATALVNIVMRLVNVVKRMLCFLHIVRRRKNSGTLLPMHVDNRAPQPPGEGQSLLPMNDQVELEAWDSWGGLDDRSDVSHRNNVHSSQQLTNENGITVYSGGRYVDTKWMVPAAEQEPQPEVDYFQEMQLEPAIKKAQKILIRKKEDTSVTPGMSSRLAMMTDIPLVGDELGTLEDTECSGWSEEAIDDLSCEFTIREKRRKEREQKLAEHQQKKLEKDMSTKTSKRAPLSGVKLTS